eukprot:g17380.t1
MKTLMRTFQVLVLCKGKGLLQVAEQKDLTDTSVLAGAALLSQQTMFDDLSVPDSSPLSEKPVCFDPSASSRRLEELVGRRRRIQAVSRKFRRALPSFRSEFKSRAAEEAHEGGARTTRATRATAPKQTEKGRGGQDVTL